MACYAIAWHTLPPDSALTHADGVTNVRRRLSVRGAVRTQGLELLHDRILLLKFIQGLARLPRL